MIDNEVLEHLKYSLCDCPIDYREDLKIFNGVCPNHVKSVLMVDGTPVKSYFSILKEKLKKLARKKSEIV